MGVWKEFNPNPFSLRTGDCAIRALCAALDVDWDTAYAMAVSAGFDFKKMPSYDVIWGSVLRRHGFERAIVPNTCPICYTAEDFAHDHPTGVYTLGFGGHCATIRDGFLFDSWDSSQECPQYFWYRKDE